ncbi:MAG TPA: hypothetical protein VKP04_02105, partial [Ktedonobacteraceae bacterium]|nr:hypothetical protein [Ktedonobacteraceae bacterium]
MIKCEIGLKEPISTSFEADLHRKGGNKPRPWGALTFLALVIIFLGIFAGQFVSALIQATSPTARVVPVDPPLLGRGGSALKSFDLPVQHTMLYVQGDNIYSVTTSKNAIETDQKEPSVATQPPVQINALGYRYNPSLPPLVTPAKQLIYA